MESPDTWPTELGKERGGNWKLHTPIVMARARHGNPLQYSCLENPMDRGAWWATIHGVTVGCD